MQYLRIYSASGQNLTNLGHVTLIFFRLKVNDIYLHCLQIFDHANEQHKHRTNIKCVGHAHRC